MGAARGAWSHRAMALLLEPPTPGPDIWADPDVLAAVDDRELGAFLRAYRGVYRRRWSQEQVARWLGKCQSQVSDLEHGRATVTSVTEIERALSALRVPEELWWTRRSFT